MMSTRFAFRLFLLSLGFLVLCVAFPPFLYADSSPLLLEDVLDRMEAAENKIGDLRCAFVETLRRNSLPEQRITGDLYLKRPHRFRLIQKGPQEQIAVSNGQTVLLYTPALKQVLTAPLHSWMAQTDWPTASLDILDRFGAPGWRRNYEILYDGYKKPVYRLRLDPRSKTEAPMQIEVSDASFLPVTVEVDESQATVRITLRDFKINSGLADSLFRLRAPAGTAVIPLNN